MHRAWTRRTRWRLAAALLLSSCSESPAPRPTPSAAPDKAALFGDASLVPTRAGERARRELGHAQQIARALELLPSVEQTRVDVELPSRSSRASPRVLAVIRSIDGAEIDALTATAERITSAVVGPDASIELIVEPGPSAPPRRPDPSVPWPLMIGLLGLGYFAGTLVERTRGLRRSTARRRAR